MAIFHDVDVGGVLRAFVEVELLQLVDGDVELPISSLIDHGGRGGPVGRA